MSDSITAIFSLGWLSGVISAIIFMGVIKDERRNKRQSKSDYISVDLIPVGDRDRSRSDRHNQQLETEIKEQAKRLGVKIGE